MKKSIGIFIALCVFTAVCWYVYAESEKTIIVTVSDTNQNSDVYYEELSGDDWRDSTYVYGYDGISSVRVSNSGNPSARFSAELKEGEYKLQFFRCRVKDADDNYAKFYTQLDGNPIELTQSDLDGILDLSLERGWVDIGDFYVDQAGGKFSFSIVQSSGSNKFLRLSAIRIIPKELDSNSALDNIEVHSDRGEQIHFSTEFETDSYSYIMYAGYRTHSVYITPTVSSEHTSYTIESETSTINENYVSLKDGVNIIKIKTLAENGINQSIYTIKIIKSEYETIDFNMPELIEKNGSWSESTVYAGPTQIATLWSNEKNNLDDTWVKYKPNFDEPGVYLIDIYRVYTPSCDQYVRWEIYHDNKLETFYVDNSYIMCDTYETLGAFYFSADGTEYIKASRADGNEEITRISAVRYRPAKDDETVISYPMFMQDGKSVYRFDTGKNISVNNSVYNYDKVFPQVFVAAYENGCLSDVSIGKNTGSQNNISQISNQINAVSSDTVKCFVWDMGKAITPLTNVWTLKQ